MKQGNKIKISLLPAGDKQVASSRLRVFSLHKMLVHDGFDSYLGPVNGVDIILVQKKVTTEILRNIEKAKKKGTKIVYDVDDVGSALDYWVTPEYFRKITDLADVLTTDTQGHCHYIRDHYQLQKNVLILPDPVDYFPSHPSRIPTKEEEKLRILWFGSLSNITLFNKYADVLTAIPNVEIVVVTTVVNELKEKYPKISFVNWSLDGFIPTLRSCQLTCLMHDGSEIDKLKSNNKMITSIAWGVPAIVSSTPEYERTAREAGIMSALFENEIDLGEVIEKFRPAKRRDEYIDASQEIIWSKYSPAAIEKTFLEIIGLLNVRKNNVPNIKTRLKTRFRSALDKFSKGSGISVTDYLSIWASPQGYDYRMSTFERQKRTGSHPLISNPSASEVKEILRVHSPKNILEVGCGWGRLLEVLADEFEIEGCDISQDMLSLCSPALKIFQHDIAVENIPFLRAHENKWDIIFTRGVMLYLMSQPVQMAYAINNMLMLAAKKIIIWEWPEVCDRMKSFSTSDKFEFHPIEHRNE